MESVLVGKETSSGMGEMLKFRRNESVALYGDSSLLFELHRVKYHKPKSCFYLPALPPNTCPRQGAKEVLSFLWELHFHLFNLPAYSSVTTVSLVLVLIFFSLTEVAQYCQVTLKMGNKALFHNINVIRNSPQEASEMNSLCSKENKVT